MRATCVAILFVAALCGAAAWETEAADYAPRRLDDAAGGWDSARFREMALNSESEESSEESSEGSEPPRVPPSSSVRQGAEAEESKEDNESELIRNMHLVATDADTDKDKELAEALQSVKDQIVHKANQIKSEKKWVHEVTKIIEAYVRKSRRVNANIRSLQKEVKTLFRKKKQVENMILQRKLESKLRLATVDLATLQAAISGVKNKEDAFKKSKHDIKTTIGALEAELAKLRGKSPAAAESSAKEF